MGTIQWTLIRSVFAIVLGIVTVKWPDQVLGYIVSIIGIMFIATGIVALLNYFSRRKKVISKSFSYIPVESIGSILLGLCLALMPTVFIGFLMYVLGFLLLLAGIFQILTVALFFYLFPVLILITGIIILINPFDSMNTVLIVFGIAAIVYGIIDIINYFKFR